MVNNSGNSFRKAGLSAVTQSTPDRLMHPAWAAFVRYCSELRHGEIALLKIQDGLPVLAEVTKKKVKFGP